mgnify:CR=1 FL=1
MSTLKGGKYPKMIGGKKKKLINIMEELLGIDHLTIGTSEQLEDRKKTLLLAEEHKLKREGERAKWEADKKRRSDEEEAAAINAGFSSAADHKASKKKDAAAAAVTKKTADAASDRTAKKDAKKRGRKIKDEDFIFTGNIEANDQTDIKKIITQLNDILRLKELELYEDIQTEPNIVLIKTINTNDGDTQISETPEQVFVAPFEDEIPDNTKKD